MPKYKIDILPVPRTGGAGEGPHWDSETRELLYVNGLEKTVHRFNPATGKEQKLLIDEDGKPPMVSFIIPIHSEPNRYVIGCSGSVCVLEWSQRDDSQSEAKISPKQLKKLFSAPQHDPPLMFNDAKCDARGRLWTGTVCFSVVEKEFNIVPGVSSLYRLDTDGHFSSQVDGIGLSNGMGWSPDNSTFYYIDSLSYRVDAFDYDLAGSISNRRPVFDLKAHAIEGLPDGMCVDSAGNLWVAVYDGGKVLNINPSTGQLIGTVEFPNKKITSCAFGGPGLEELYVTSATLGLSEAEIVACDAGSLYKVTGLGVKGASPGVAYSGKV